MAADSVTGLTSCPREIPPGGLLTLSEVTARLKASRETVYRLVADGDLEAIDIAPRSGKHRMLRFSETALSRFEEQRSLRGVQAGSVFISSAEAGKSAAIDGVSGKVEVFVN